MLCHFFSALNTVSTPFLRTDNHIDCIMSENNKKRSINDVLVWNNKKVAANSIQPLIFGELIGDIDHEQGDESTVRYSGRGSVS